MSLDLPQLLPQVQQLSQALAERQARHLEALKEATRSYHALAALPPSELEARIQLAGSRWTGARAPEEGFPPSIAPPETEAGLVVSGADGSQVYPDRHAAAAFYLINIAAIRLQHDQAEAPQTFRKTDLYFEEAQLHYESGQPIGNPWVSLQRDVGEMRMLADICQAGAGRPGLVLLDNSLLLWMVLQAHSAGQEALDRCLKDYLASMEAIRSAGQALAGIIDRPRSQNVLALAGIASLPQALLEAGEIPAVQFEGLSDSQLFASLLPPGHRSPCFGLVSPLNRDFEAAGHDVHFFYLHSSPGQILRVEVPGWSARNQGMLARIHAGVLRECSTTGGYPYVLVRAHELAVVTQAESRLLEDWIGRELAGSGMPALSSQKAWMKTHTASAGL